MSTQVWFTVLVLLVVAERLAELRVASTNRARALREGGIEYGAGHYRLIVLLQAGLFGGCLIEIWLLPRHVVPVLAASMLAVVILAQTLRWWCITTLRHRWNTRVIVVAHWELSRSGPYRWLTHPNYVAVVAEGLALPLVHTAWITAAGFTALNAALLAQRIRTENRALATVRRPL